jgi:hypothetical protein
MDKSKEAFLKVWSNLSPQEQVDKVYSFLQANRAGSKFPDDPLWDTLSKDYLAQAQQKGGEWVEVLEAAKRPGESVDDVGSRFMQHLTQGSNQSTVLGVGVVIAVILFFTLRRRGGK